MLSFGTESGHFFNSIVPVRTPREGWQHPVLAESERFIEFFLRDPEGNIFIAPKEQAYLSRDNRVVIVQHEEPIVMRRNFNSPQYTSAMIENLNAEIAKVETRKDTAYAAEDFLSGSQYEAQIISLKNLQEAYKLDLILFSVASRIAQLQEQISLEANEEEHARLMWELAQEKETLEYCRMQLGKEAMSRFMVH